MRHIFTTADGKQRAESAGRNAHEVWRDAMHFSRRYRQRVFIWWNARLVGSILAGGTTMQ